MIQSRQLCLILVLAGGLVAIGVQAGEKKDGSQQGIILQKNGPQSKGAERGIILQKNGPDAKGADKTIILQNPAPAASTPR